MHIVNDDLDILLRQVIIIYRAAGCNVGLQYKPICNPNCYCTVKAEKERIISVNTARPNGRSYV